MTQSTQNNYRRFTFAIHFILITLGIALVAPAQETDTPAEPFTLDSVMVIGSEDLVSDAFDSGRLAGSYDFVSRDELEYEHPDDTLELFSKVPGVAISRYNQGVINTDVSIRGFAGDGVTPHAKLLIDGIPANLHNGYNELDQMFPMAIGSMETFKGTGDLRYGLFNTAGNYSNYSRADVAQELQLTYGSFDTIEAQGYFEFKNGDLTHNYFAGYRGILAWTLVLAPPLIWVTLLVHPLQTQKPAHPMAELSLVSVAACVSPLSGNGRSECPPNAPPGPKKSNASPTSTRFAPPNSPNSKPWLPTASGLRDIERAIQLLEKSEALHLDPALRTYITRLRQLRVFRNVTHPPARPDYPLVSQRHPYGGREIGSPFSANDRSDSKSFQVSVAMRFSS